MSGPGHWNSSTRVLPEKKRPMASTMAGSATSTSTSSACSGRRHASLHCDQRLPHQLPELPGAGKCMPRSGRGSLTWWRSRLRR